MSKTALVVGYIRVSTKEQVLRGYSPEVQRHHIERYARCSFEAEPYELVFYEDLGDTGGIGLRQHPDIFKKYRKGLSDAIDLLVAESSTRSTHFVALDQSRVERTPLVWHVLTEVYATDRGIRFHFVDEGGEMQLSPEDEANRGQKSLNSRSFRQQTGRRVSQANEYRVKQGYHQGFPAYGWRKVPNRDGLKWADLEPNPEQRDVVLMIKDKLLAGWGSWRIARYLDAQGILSPSGKPKWYPETVRSVARDRLHAGYVRWKDQSIKGRHFDLRFWDIELTNELDRLMKQRHRANKRGVKLERFLLAGMLTCGHCGRPMISYHDYATGNRYYKCDGRLIPTNKSHPACVKRASMVETAVTDAVAELLGDPIIQTLTANRVGAMADEQLAQLRNEEQRLGTQRHGAAGDLAEAIAQSRRGELAPAAYEAAKSHIEHRISELDRRLAQAADRRRYLVGHATRLERARQAARDFSLLWEQLEVEERRGILQAFIEDIAVTREGRNVRLQINYHFMPPSQVLLRPLRGTSGGDGPDSLSLRELAMLYLWDQGLRYRDIAKQFDVSEMCIRQLVHTMRRKLGLWDEDDIVAAARGRFELEKPYLPMSGRMCKRPGDGALLTPTEQSVLQGLAEGLTYRQIARRAGKAMQTLYGAAFTMRQKLDVASNAEAVKKAAELGLLEPPANDDQKRGADCGGGGESASSTEEQPAAD